MEFRGILKQYNAQDLKNKFNAVSAEKIKTIISKDKLESDDLLVLLSPQAEPYLELMAQKANQLTVQYFGKVIQLYTPLYLSNYCINSCAYCGFKAENSSQRKKLSLSEVKKEAEFISATGLKHILILTGDSRQMSPVSYIQQCVEILKDYFSSIAIETYALSQEEYAQLIRAGIDGVTIYQEVYDRAVYAKVHLNGPKKDYDFRLDAAQRALFAGIRTANVGVLLGLNNWREEVFFMAMHAGYLQEKFLSAEIGVSVPRIKPHLGDFADIIPVSDKNLTQIILALRIFLPRAGINLSTRETAKLRDDLLALGITRISAGSTTAVGGHTLNYEQNQDEQFQISDKRDVAQIKQMLQQKQYQPVLKDWLRW
ncbi:MAG: 2-iminoacetate synthase ThiH [Candidatus Omnitrophica bacterium]|nr:2-iminoacetate synthase ThiH [Candidatus Omnitrophota bacterium]